MRNFRDNKQIKKPNNFSSLLTKRAWKYFLFDKSLFDLKSLHTSQVAHKAGVYLGFCSMKRLEVFLLPAGWDASPSQGYPTASNSPVSIYTSGWREALWERCLVQEHDAISPARAFMSRIERKHFLISTSYLAGLLDIFISLHIWQNCVCFGDFFFTNEGTLWCLS